MIKARDNPFRTDRIHRVRYRLLDESWPQVIERLARLQYRAAIVGPEGSGKTTLMEDLEPHLRRSGYTVRHVRLTRDRRRFEPGELRELSRTLGPREIVLFDGAEQLSRIGWWWFRFRIHRCGGVIITSHREGMLPTLIRCRTNPSLLREVVGELVDDREVDARELDDLFRRHDGNIREALRELYDCYALSC